MNKWSKVLISLAGSFVALGGLGWWGLQVPPRNFSLPANAAQDLGTVAIPAALPAPVRRYLQVAFGDQVPRVESMVAWGRARARFGLWMPLRFLLYHRPGQAFKRDMEVAWFGLPVLKAMDQYIDGKGMTGPVGNAATGPEVDQGSNMILWAEATFYPSLLITDPRIRWEAIDDSRARLLFPFGDQQDELIFHFDPQTGLVTRTWALRYQGATGEKTPWYAEIVEWQSVNGMQLPRRVAVTWEKEGSPWSEWTFDGIRWNVDITQQLPTAAAVRSVHKVANLRLNGERSPWLQNH